MATDQYRAELDAARAAEREARDPLARAEEVAAAARRDLEVRAAGSPARGGRWWAETRIKKGERGVRCKIPHTT